MASYSFSLFPKLLMKLYILSYVYTTCLILLWILRNSLYVLDNDPLLVVCVVDIFSQFVFVLFDLVWFWCLEQKFLISTWDRLFYGFFFLSCLIRNSMPGAMA